MIRIRIIKVSLSFRIRIRVWNGDRKHGKGELNIFLLGSKRLPEVTTSANRYEAFEKGLHP